MFLLERRRSRQGPPPPLGRKNGERKESVSERAPSMPKTSNCARGTPLISTRTVRSVCVSSHVCAGVMKPISAGYSTCTLSRVCVCVLGAKARRPAAPHYKGRDFATDALCAMRRESLCGRPRRVYRTTSRVASCLRPASCTLRCRDQCAFV